ncbi:CHAD domain-containing protein [Thiomicrorhabdus sp. Milos-T2]|uniref:CHAD domain-containing protein n=1 Tax=Thiomicrorhabdus sp. Milos-T2 TaxID=90814 RepID=UPI000494836E|nr:CHAD domain-containing protein [Thiomicrorhabdus sp. Milos-T2]
MKADFKKLNKTITCYNHLDDEDPKLVECLHNLRIAARKLIVVMNPEDFIGLNLKKLIQASNKIRDLDVFITEILPQFPKKWHSEFKDLLRVLNNRRVEMNHDFKITLTEEWLSDLNDEKILLSGEHETSQSQLKRQQMDLKEIEKRLKKALKEVKSIDIEDKHLHKIRLVSKRLRYQLMRFYPQETKLIKTTKLLQAKLGDFHDIYQAIKLLKQNESLLTPKTFKHCNTFLNDKKAQILVELRKELRH